MNIKLHDVVDVIFDCIQQRQNCQILRALAFISIMESLHYVRVMYGSKIFLHSSQHKHFINR